MNDTANLSETCHAQYQDAQATPAMPHMYVQVMAGAWALNLPTIYYTRSAEITTENKRIGPSEKQTGGWSAS